MTLSHILVGLSIQRLPVLTVFEQLGANQKPSAFLGGSGRFNDRNRMDGWPMDPDLNLTDSGGCGHLQLTNPRFRLVSCGGTDASRTLLPLPAIICKSYPPPILHLPCGQVWQALTWVVGEYQHGNQGKKKASRHNICVIRGSRTHQ